MAYDYTIPQAATPVAAQEIREALQAISTHHQGPLAPPDPEAGFTWLDTSDPTNHKMKIFVNGPGFIIIAEHMENNPIFSEIEKDDLDNSLAIFEGDNPPPMINLDDFDFEDAAGFEFNQDQDIIFKIQPRGKYTHGIKLRMKYCMSTAEPNQLKFRLDYRVKIAGDPTTGGTDYSTTHLVTPVNLANTMAFNEELIIPATVIDNSVQIVHCRLTREGLDPIDTHDGTFCLIDLYPKVMS